MTKANKFFIETRGSLYLLVIKKEKNIIVLTKVLSRCEDNQINNQIKGNNISLNSIGKNLSLSIKKDRHVVFTIPNIIKVYGEIRPYKIND